MRNALHPHVSLVAIIFIVLTGPELSAQTRPVKAEVWALQGGAIYAAPGEGPKHLNLGTALSAGTVIQTGQGTALDIRLGKEAGVVRVTENSTLSLNKLAAVEMGSSNMFDIELHVQAGSILGDVPKLPSGSKYYVKVSNGITGVRHGQFRINAQGFVVLLQGDMLVAHIPAAGDPTPHPLTAPPPVYFSPLEGVRQAPPPLVQEVRNQLNARLRVP